ncbi:MAG TPA: BamA/TamA family outer membrane protein [Kofleriaceae bacterium]
MTRSPLALAALTVALAAPRAHAQPAHDKSPEEHGPVASTPMPEKPAETAPTPDGEVPQPPLEQTPDQKPPKAPEQPTGAPPTPPEPATTPQPADNIPSRRATWVDEPPSTTPVPQDDPTANAEWHAHRSFSIAWTLLSLPERAVELVFLPIGMLVSATEEYRLDKRFADLVTIGEVVKIAPRFKFSFGDGAGAGLWLKRTALFDDRAEARIGFIYRLNADYQVETEYKHALLLPGGRAFRARAYYEKDQNQRYYGIGGDTPKSNRRVIESDDYGAYLETDLQGIDRYTYSGTATIGMKRQKISSGTDSTYASLLPTDDTTIGLPPGFDAQAIYLDAKVAGNYDTRDTAGRPRQGLLVNATVLARSDVTGKNLSGVTFSSFARYHIPVFSEGRTLVLQFGGSAASNLFPGDKIPLDSLSVIDRLSVRGYDRERFRDKYALIATAEYRFPIYEYLTSRVGLDAFVFLDGGTLWGASKFLADPIRYSYGTGVRGGHETSLLFEAFVGKSPESTQFNVGVEKAL